MNSKNISISVIVPFFNGNRYINELLLNISLVMQELITDFAPYIEVIIINDSPDIRIEYLQPSNIDVRIICNTQNIGIHQSRVKGVKNAKGNWIIFLDQDDLLIPERYSQQIKAIGEADVVVGNGYYYFGENKQKIYANKQVMEYLIQEKNLIGLRNLIPSPGECLIKKNKIPTFWLNNNLKCNGSDDWLLWLLLFNSKAVFTTNNTPIYIHRNSLEGNLSFDLEKMNRSNIEMCKLLQSNPSYAKNKRKTLERGIKFKFLYDTKKLKFVDILYFIDRFLVNIIYKIKVKYLIK